MPSRRHVLAFIGLCPPALTLAPRILFAGQAPRIITDPLSADQLRTQLGQWFEFRDGSGIEAHPMQLVEVRPGPQVPGLEQHSLVFKAKGGPLAFNGLQRVRTPADAELLLHVQPTVGNAAVCTAPVCRLRAA